MSLPNTEWQESILNESDEQLLEEIAANRQILEDMEADAAAGRWLENIYLSSSAQALPGWYYEQFAAEAERRGLTFQKYPGKDIPGHHEWDRRYWWKRREELYGIKPTLKERFMRICRMI